MKYECSSVPAIARHNSIEQQTRQALQKKNLKKNEKKSAPKKNL